MANQKPLKKPPVAKPTASLDPAGEGPDTSTGAPQDAMDPVEPESQGLIANPTEGLNTAGTASASPCAGDRAQASNNSPVAATPPTETIADPPTASPTSTPAPPPDDGARPQGAHCTSPSSSTSMSVQPEDENKAPEEFALFRDNPFYLASTGVEKRVGWVQIDRAQHLVSSDDAAAAKNGRLLQPTPVVLSVVTQITREDCWLAPDGNWTGKKPNGPDFQNIKLKFTGGAPSCHPLLVKDFRFALDHMDRIMRSVALPGAITEGGLVVSNAFGTQQKKFALRHAVFQRATEEDTNQDDTQEWSIDKWPVRSDAARDALADILSTHIARPLNAHDVDGKLIEPERYDAMLRGATVLLSFTVSHYRISGNNKLKDVYCFDVDAISVLVPPDPATVVSPKKTRVRQNNPLAAQLGPAFKKLKRA